MKLIFSFVQRIMALRPLPVKNRLLTSTMLTQSSSTSTGTTSRPMKYKAWTNENLERACHAVMQEGVSLRRAAEEYQIPKSTIQDHVSGKVFLGSKSGRQYLTESEEKELVTFILRSARIGYPRTRKQIIGLVQYILEQKGHTVSVTSGWWNSFSKRHPEVSLRTPEDFSHARHHYARSETVHNYFDLLEETIISNELESTPSLIFNCDETGMPLNAKPPKVAVKTGTKHSRCVTTGDKSQITVLACCSAAGFILPPFVIFDHKVLKPELCVGEVNGTMYGLSDSGWINSELFELWFLHHFLPHAPAGRPLLLLLDGHSSHYNPTVIRKAAEERVIIFCLPPHSSHETQPLDKGPFGPLKSCWREVCHKFMSENPGKIVTRFTFSQLFNEAWTKAMTIQNISAGFRSTGIYPLNRNALLPPPQEEENSLAERTGLKFIPLYSPMKRKSTPKVLRFSEEEEKRFQKRYEEGYDLKDDMRYNNWKEIHYPEPQDKAVETDCDSVTSDCQPSSFTNNQVMQPIIVYPQPPHVPAVPSTSLVPILSATIPHVSELLSVSLAATSHVPKMYQYHLQARGNLI